MPAKLRSFGVGALSGLMVLLMGCGITAPRSSEGFANLDSLGVFDTDRHMALSIGPAVIRLTARLVEEDDPETATLLRELEGIRIRIYEIDGDPARVAARIQRMSAHLQEDRWEPVMLIREEREQTHMLIRQRGDRILGLTLINSDGDSEAVVINLMGHLDPAHFSDVMLALEVDAPEVQVAPAGG
ncbi:MAG TPA: DUF4252 domain-containing protein [Xanthomonadales bacterium]|nr:DUF4252 domain-containing protein [Xanthomonadales bacterium]